MSGPADTPPPSPPPPFEGPIWCHVCCRLLNGPTQWEDHISGRQHKKKKLRAKLGYRWYGIRWYPDR